MANVNCQICKTEFYAKPSHLRLGYGKYCSLSCSRQSQKTGTYLPCYQCNTLTWKTPKDIRKSKSGYLFCSKKCSMAWKNANVLSGINHPLWKGGHSMYRERLEKVSKNISCQDCGITDMRVLVVHHKDQNRQNNKLSNLVWLCRNCHYIIHNGKTV